MAAKLIMVQAIFLTLGYWKFIVLFRQYFFF